VLSAMLASLGDGHVVLEAGGRQFHSGRPGELRELWMKQTGAGVWPAAQQGYTDAVRRHVEEQVLGGRASRGANGILSWGWVAPGVGYLSISAMRAPAADGAGSLDFASQLELVDAAMTLVRAQFADARAMVLDTRFNDGGYDGLGLRILSSFSSKRLLAFTKHAVTTSGPTEEQAVHIEPGPGDALTLPIIHLHSGSTVSAAEIFTLAVMALPRAVRVGTPTYGALSDMLGKRMPNGWWLSLSNEVYTATDGQCYEGRGIPPDVRVDVDRAVTFEERASLDISKALELAQTHPATP
jgi:C-terminal processing protease CtpA/Prc